ncbi:heat shock 70 kDa protein 15-like [Iris pallida]|uniref:Heat shock 70 kDa protein 15-like n=1 Tax=Iris pallida TaxID=29817 RepID=A0AAX6E6T9_IRIPA|nr:heat shock 70 kDa protein 15-like [Iris pallida]
MLTRARRWCSTDETLDGSRRRGFTRWRPGRVSTGRGLSPVDLIGFRSHGAAETGREGPSSTGKGRDWRSRWSSGSENRRPTRSLIWETVPLGFIMEGEAPVVWALGRAAKELGMGIRCRRQGTTIDFRVLFTV